MSPIEAALLAGLRGDEQRGDLSRLTALSQDQWEAVATLATRQRMTPLLVHRLGPTGVLDRVPEHVRRGLERRTGISTLRALRLQAAFLSLARAVSPLGIPLIALKGLHLASGIYERPGLREMIDIDVLVEAEEVPAVLEAATQLGYQLSEPVDVATYLAFHHHLPRLAKGDINFEVHWHIGLRGVPSPPDSAELRARAQPLALTPLARGFCPEDLLLHVGIHGSMLHTFEQGLRCLCDVWVILEQYGGSLRWEDVISRSHSWGVSRSMLLVLTLTRDLLGAAVPGHVLQSLGAADLAPHVVTASVELIFSERSTAPTVSEQATQLVATGSMASKARQLWRRIWLQGEVAALRRTSLRPSPFSLFRFRLRRLVVLLGRYSWQLPALALGRRTPAWTTVSRRHTVAEWLRGNQS